MSLKKIISCAILVCAAIYIAPVVAAQTLRDPTAPLGHAKALTQAPRLKLQGIFLNTGKPKALINGINVYEGEQFLGNTLLRIENNKVVYRRNGKILTLSLWRSIRE